MTTSRKLAEIAAATLIALGMTIPVQAKQVQTEKYPLVDTRPTGSILSFGRACDPNKTNAKIACRITGSEQAPKYPSAPINPAFGI